jgi:hypothetical protein
VASQLVPEVLGHAGADLRWRRGRGRTLAAAPAAMPAAVAARLTTGACRTCGGRSVADPGRPVHRPRHRDAEARASRVIRPEGWDRRPRTPITSISQPDVFVRERPGRHRLALPADHRGALVAYPATARLHGPAARYAWSVVVLAAGLSGPAQAVYLAGGPPSTHRRGCDSGSTRGPRSPRRWSRTCSPSSPPAPPPRPPPRLTVAPAPAMRSLARPPRSITAPDPADRGRPPRRR